MLMAPAAGALGGVIHVPASQPTIQSAIDAAAAGDVVLVAPGTYHEALRLVGKPLTLRSSGGAAATVIDAAGLGLSAIRCIDGEGALTVIDGFTITGGGGTLESNRRKGGGMLNRQSSPTVLNCTFLDNEINAYGFSIQGSGGGMYNEQASPTVTNCAFVGNDLNGCSGWLNGGAGMYNDASSPTITGCLFVDNQGNNGGGVMNVNQSNPIIRDCFFGSNSVTFSGGGLNNTNGANASVINCLFADNTAYHGAGLYTTSAPILMANCTVTGNVAQATAAGLYVMYATASSSVANCIFRDNLAVQQPASSEIVRLGGALMTVNNTNVEGGWSGPGWSNIDADPMFADPVAGDYHLMPGSPSVDTGLNLSLPPGVSTDLDGAARVVAGTVDMGSYELQEPSTCGADVSGDGVVNVQDMVAVVESWGACAACATCPADATGDCVVNTADLAAVVNAWGACP
jgi:hypothetical protein